MCHGASDHPKPSGFTPFQVPFSNLQFQLGPPAWQPKMLAGSLAIPSYLMARLVHTVPTQQTALQCAHGMAQSFCSARSNWQKLPKSVHAMYLVLWVNLRAFARGVASATVATTYFCCVVCPFGGTRRDSLGVTNGPIQRFDVFPCSCLCATFSTCHLAIGKSHLATCLPASSQWLVLLCDILCLLDDGGENRGHKFCFVGRGDGCMGMPCTQCARSAKFCMSVTTRTLVLALLRRFVVPS